MNETRRTSTPVVLLHQLWPILPLSGQTHVVLDWVAEIRAEENSTVRFFRSRRVQCWERFLERSLLGIFVPKYVLGTFKLTTIVRK